MQVLGLAAHRTGRQLRHDPGGEQQLEAEREPVRGPRLRGVGVQQRQLVGQQPEHLGVRLGRLEQARDRVARACRGVERRGVVAQRPMRRDRVDRR